MSRPSRPQLQATRKAAMPMRASASASAADAMMMRDVEFDMSTPDEAAAAVTTTTRHKGGNKATAGTSASAAPALSSHGHTASTSSFTNPDEPSMLLLSPSRSPPATGARHANNTSGSGSGSGSASRHFLLTPGVVEFLGVQGGEIYFMLLTIQNITTRRRALKILPPQSDAFSMELSTVHTEIAPGLTLKMKIYFQCPLAPVQTPEQSDEEFEAALRRYANQSWHDRIVVVSGENAPTDRFHIPLHAWSRRAQITFDSLVNFGSIQPAAPSMPGAGAGAAAGVSAAAAATHTHMLSLRNDGTMSGSFRVEFDRGVPLVVSPSSGVLAPAGEPGCETSLRVELNTTELALGPFRALGRLFLDANPVPLVIDVSANLVEASLQLIWPTLPGAATLHDLAALGPAQQLERVSEVFFGSIYFGETRRIEALLFNNSPHPLNFLVNLTDARDDKSGGGGGMGMERSRGATRRPGMGPGPGSSYASSSPPIDARSVPGSVHGDHDLESALEGGHAHAGGGSGGAAAGPGAYRRPDMAVEPMEGRLEPYASTKLCFVFQPRQPASLRKEMMRGFKNSLPATGGGGGGGGAADPLGSSGALVGMDGAAIQVERAEPPYVRYGALCKIDSLDGRYRATVPVLGHANVPAVSLSSDLFDFGVVPVHEHRDHYLTIKNVSTTLPLAFEFAPVAQFHARPSFGRLGARESMRVVLSFAPNNLGRFVGKTMKLVLLGSPGGKKPSTRVPLVHASAASMKQASLASSTAAGSEGDSARIEVSLRLSGVSDSLGLNRTIELSTGGPLKLASDFAPKVRLVPAASARHEEKEMALLASGDAEVDQELQHDSDADSDAERDGDAIHFSTPGAARAEQQQSKQKNKKFSRTTGWNNPELAGQYQGRYEVQEGSLDNRVTFTPGQLAARTENHKFYEEFVRQSRRERLRAATKRPEDVPEPADPSSSSYSPEKPRDAQGMGLRFASGLSSPRVPLPPAQEFLQLRYPMAGFEAQGRKRLTKPSAGAGVGGNQKKKPLKTAPSTQAERKDCEQVLSPADLSLVSRGPKLLEFGRICCGGVAKKTWSVANDLQSHVQVQLRLDDDQALPELSRTTTRSALIPPGETAEFHLIFSSTAAQEFSRSVVYSINGGHEFNFLVSASVVPVDLLLSRDEVVLEFRESNTSFVASEALYLENPYTVSTEYYFSTPSHLDCFTLVPHKGLVAPGGRSKVELRFEPRGCTPAGAPIVADVLLNIVGGGQKKVAVRASLPEASCFFVRGVRSLDFGYACVGTPVTKAVSLRNDGSTRTVFRVEDVPQGVRVRPLSGRIDPGTTVALAVTLYPTPEMRLKSPGSFLTVAVRGRPREAKPLRLALKAEAVLPTLALAVASDDAAAAAAFAGGNDAAGLSAVALDADAEGEIAFGGVTLGSSLSKSLLLRNEGPVGATVFLDLSKWSEFSLSYPDDLGRESAGSNGGVRPPIVARVAPAAVKRNAALVTAEGAEAASNSAAAAGGGYTDDSEESSAAGAAAAAVAATGAPVECYSIFLSPRSIVPLSLCYTPSRVVEHTLELPLSVAGIPSYPSLRRLVSARGLKPKISLSTSCVDFGKRVVLKPGRAAKLHPYVARFSLRNEDARALGWSLRPSAAAGAGADGSSTPNSHFGSPVSSSRGGAGPSRGGAFTPAVDGGAAGAMAEWAGGMLNSPDGPWRLEPCSGTLAPGQEASILVHFAPTIAQNYELPVDIFVDQFQPLGGGGGIGGGSATGLDAGSFSRAAGALSVQGGGAGARSNVPSSLSLQSDAAGGGAPSKPYTSLRLLGVGTTPRLLFSSTEVVLPTVPLGVKSRASFTVQNEGYETLELRWELNQDAVRAPVQIYLPQGATLSANHPVLPVEVVFLSRRPVSFQAALDFFDGEGRKFSVSLVGTSDNSVITTAQYLESHPGGYVIELEKPLPDSNAAAAAQAAQAEGGKSSHSHSGAGSGSGAPYNKVLHLVELASDSVQARQRAAEAARFKKQMRSASRATAGGAGGDDGDDADGDAEEDAESNPDMRLAPMRGSGSGGVAKGSSSGGGSSSNNGGNSLFTRTLENVLAYLHASGLLGGGDPEEFEGADSPPNGKERRETSAAAKASAGAAANNGKASSKRPSSSPSSSAAAGSGSGAGALSLSASTFPSELVKSGGQIVRNLVRNLTGKTVPTMASKKAAGFGRDKQVTTISLQSKLSAPTQVGDGGSAAGFSSTQDLGSTLTSRELSGGHLLAAASAKADEALHTLYQDYEELIIFLKSQGCLLGAIKPWHLLAWNQLLRLLHPTGSTAASKGTFSFTELGVSAAMSAGEIAARHRGLERDFPSLSRHAWLSILLQLIRVFIVGRIDLRSFRALPGMSSTLPCMSYSFASSNVYSMGESILLEWAGFHYNRSNPLQPRLVSDFGALGDGLVLAGVVASHVPGLQSIAHMRTHVSSADDMLYNATKVLLALRSELGLSYAMTPSGLVAARARDMLLFVLFLYQTLPCFVPRSTLEFKVALGQDATQCIELSNPGAKPIRYSVYLEGGEGDFTVDARSVSLAPRGRPGSTVKFPVRFHARFSRVVEARLVFTASAPEGGRAPPSNASTLVFLLKSHVASRTALQSYTASSRVYETQVIDVRVTNIFTHDCTFIVSVKLDSEPMAGGPVGPGAPGSKGRDREGSPSRSASNAQLDERASARGGGPAGARIISARSNASVRSFGGGGGASSGSSSANDKLPPPFFCPFERIKLRAGETQSLGVHFLPLRMGNYKAQLVFLDENVGEFMVSLACTGTAPAPLELFKWSTHGGSEQKDLQFSFKNPWIDVARAQTFERVRNLSRQQRDLKKLRQDWGHQVLRADLLPSGSSVAYSVTSTSPFFLVTQPALTLADVRLDKDSLGKGRSGALGGTASLGGGGGGGASNSRKGTTPGGPAIITDLTTPSKGGSYSSYTSGGKHAHDNRATLVFNPRGPGIYRGTLVLSSAFDVRSYALEATVTPADSTPQLDFCVPARQSATQELPLRNSGSELAVFKAVLTGKGFTGPPEVTVYPGTAGGCYPLSFAPAWVGESIGSLVLSNAKTDEKISFDLRGVGEEPLAEAHVSISAAARSTVQHTLAVSNTSTTDIYYSVEAEGLPSFRGASTFRVGAGSTADYSFTLSPSRSGTLGGTVTFTAPDKRFQWFGITVQVHAPNPEAEVVVECVARRAANVAVPVTNPTDRPLELEVNLEGVGLFGPRSMRLGPRETAEYEFLYSPLLPVAQSEGALNFHSVAAGGEGDFDATGGGDDAAAAGEMWFKLLLRSPTPPAEEVSFGVVEVGSSAEVEVRLENPTNEALVLRSVVTGRDARAFGARPASVTVPPLSSVSVALRYTPSTLGAEQRATLSFSHPSVASYSFACRGSGGAPGPSAPTMLATPLGTKLSRTLPFRNPFAHPIRVDVELTAEGQQAQGTGPSAAAVTGSGSRPSRSGASSASTMGPSNVSGASASSPGPGPGPTFELLLRRTGSIVVAPYSMLQIPFQFAPTSIRAHRGAISVRMEPSSTSPTAAAAADASGSSVESSLAWTYPLHGETEGSVSEAPLVLSCLAREGVEEVRELRLAGLPHFQSLSQSQQVSGSPRPEEQFSVHVECESDAAQVSLTKWLRLALLESESAASLQRVSLSLRPLVPFRAEGFVVVSRRAGGRWKFPLVVSVGPPAPDDTIRVEAAVHTTASVAFRLQNFKSTPTPFTASLSADSAAQFSVHPRSGVLPPPGEVDDAGHTGRQFVISFAPTEYGQPLHGTLHVVCGDAMAYTYAIVGTNVRYEAPTGTSQLDNHNEAYVRAKQQAAGGSGSGPAAAKRAVNHVAANVRALKDVPLLSQKVSKVRAWKGVGNTSSAAIAAASAMGFPALSK